jgi:peptide/nickel transport system ATP-binding protein
LPDKAFRVTKGAISVLGQDMLAASEADLLRLRGSDVAMIFQEPLTALNPTRRIGDLMVEVILAHQKITKAEAQAKAVDLLQQMRIADAKAVMRRYPFELSGGMRQRIVIALAIANDPRLVIADEPTTALDVTVQRQVLTLLQNRARDVGAAVLLITHDLGVVSEYAYSLYVMDPGKVAESGPTDVVLRTPATPTPARCSRQGRRLRPSRPRLPRFPATCPTCAKRLSAAASPGAALRWPTAAAPRNHRFATARTRGRALPAGWKKGPPHDRCHRT